MVEVIDYYFVVLGQIFNLILSSWLFSFSLLLGVFALIVALSNKVKGDK